MRFDGIKTPLYLFVLSRNIAQTIDVTLPAAVLPAGYHGDGK